MSHTKGHEKQPQSKQAPRAARLAAEFTGTCTRPTADGDRHPGEWWRSDSSGTDEDEVMYDTQHKHSTAQQPPNSASAAQLYDPDVDEEDERWAVEQRQGRESDAILSCPGCFTTLCIDCQQHEEYHNQYRAMFVMNCKVGGVPEPPVGSGTKTRKRRGYGAEAANDLLSVKCEVCETEVGVRDKDEIYHFYHVFPSNA